MYEEDKKENLNANKINHVPTMDVISREKARIHNSQSVYVHKHYLRSV